MLCCVCCAQVKYLLLSQVSGYLRSGSGVWKFRLLNLRADNAFVLFRGGLDHPTLAARSNAVSFMNPNEPLGVHLALSADPDSMLVTWNSGLLYAVLCCAVLCCALGLSSLSLSLSHPFHSVVCVAGTQGSPMVRWGTEPGVYQWSASAVSSTYTAADMCGEPATGAGYLPQGMCLLLCAWLLASS